MLPGQAQKCENCGAPFVEGDAVDIVKLCPKCKAADNQLFAILLSGRKLNDKGEFVK